MYLYIGEQHAVFEERKTLHEAKLWIRHDDEKRSVGPFVTDRELQPDANEIEILEGVEHGAREMWFVCS